MSDNTIKIVLEISVVDGNVKVTTSPPAITVPAESSQDIQATGNRDSELVQNGTSRVSSPTPVIVASAVPAQVAPITRNNMMHVKIANDIHNAQKAKAALNEQTKPTVATVQNVVEEELQKQPTQGKSCFPVYPSQENTTPRLMANVSQVQAQSERQAANQQERMLLQAVTGNDQRAVLAQQLLQALHQQQNHNIQQVVQDAQRATSQQSQFDIRLEEVEEEQEVNEYDDLEKSLNETLAREQQRLAQALAEAIPINHDSLSAVQQRLRDQEAERLRRELARAEFLAQKQELSNIQQQIQQLSIAPQLQSVQLLNFLQQQQHAAQRPISQQSQLDEEHVEDECEANDLAQAQQSLAQALAQAIPINNDSLLAVQQRVQVHLLEQAAIKAQAEQARAQQARDLAARIGESQTQSQRQALLLSLMQQSQKARDDERAAQAILYASLAAQTAAHQAQQMEQRQRDFAAAMEAEAKAQGLFNNQKHQQN